MDFDRALELFRALGDEGVEYAVFGALALSAHGIVRATVDANVFVRPTEPNLAALRRALRRLWPEDASIDEITAEDLAGDYPAVRYVPPEGELTIDIVSRLGEAFAFDDLETELITLEGVPVRVVTARMLYRMKRHTLRAKDRADAEALERAFGFKE